MADGSQVLELPPGVHFPGQTSGKLFVRPEAFPQMFDELLRLFRGETTCIVLTGTPGVGKRWVVLQPGEGGHELITSSIRAAAAASIASLPCDGRHEL